jgi:DNA polymerase-3 subunit delta'
MLSEIQIDQTVLKRFAALSGKNRLAHAYLLIGPADIGKGETALAIAQLLLCEAKKDDLPCGQCPSCAKVGAGTHPDVLIIANAPGESIKIEQMRELMDRMKLTPFLGTKKVVIIRNTEQFTPDSANAFLKTLEEPSASTLMLLTTSVPEQNPDTIRSRCHAVYFQPLTNGELERRLGEYRLNPGDTHFLAHFAQGCPGTAKRLMDGGVVGYKDEVIEGFILRRPSEEYIKETIADKERTKVFLNILFSWVRDAILVKSGIEDGRLIHLDRFEALSLFAQEYSFEQLNDLSKSVVHMHKLLADNLNIKLPLLIIGEQLWEK